MNPNLKPDPNQTLAHTLTLSILRQKWQFPE